MTQANEAVHASTLEFEGGQIPARFALVLRPGQQPGEVAAAAHAMLPAANIHPLSTLDPGVLVLELPGRVFGPDDALAFQAAYALTDELGVAAAEPDLTTDFYPDPNAAGDGKDPREEGLGGFPPGCWAEPQPELDDDPMWAPRLMRVPEAWDYSERQGRPSRGEGITIAQPDTGVTAHKELAGVVSVPGWNLLTGGGDPTDPLESSLLGNPGHGTATASVVVSPATAQVTGTAPLARHMAIRAIDSVVRMSQVSVAEAIDWATERGAHVITMSLGGVPSFALHRALRRAVEADVVVLAAAGNCVRFVVWPARYEECVAVGGTTNTDGIWPGSCRGSAVDVSAPAQNVLRAKAAVGADDSAIGQGQGTSFAVAMTAGVAALWLAHHGRANLVAAARARGETLQAMFLRLVRATARRPEEWNPFEMGVGIVDARVLLEADLDLGRDREATPPPAGSSTAATVRTLVAEAAGPAAAQDDELDWHRYGPEIATMVLRRQLNDSEEAAGMSASESLDRAAANDALRTYLNLETGPAYEVGEG